MERTRKTSIMEQYRQNPADTGSPEVQIALLTERISSLTGHMKSHRKDSSTRRGLVMLVGKRRRLLNYLKDREIERYRSVVSRLGLRK